MTIALFFSSFSTPYLSGFMTLGTYLIGKGGQLLQRFIEGQTDAALKLLAGVADRVLPGLYIFDVSMQVTYDLTIPTRFIYHATSYGLIYSAVLLLLGVGIFSRRDFI